MSLTTSAHWAYNPGGDFYGYTIDGSLQFAESTNYLTRTPSSAGNQKTWTYSAWVKRGKIGSTNYYLFSPTRGGDGTNESVFRFDSSQRIDVYDSGATRGRLITTAKFRDNSAWYHIVFVLDTTNATSSERMRLYINGERVTAFDTYSAPSQNTDWGWNATREHSIGTYNYGADAYHFDGYMAEINHVDGQALDASSFGETKSGIWIPKEYSGSYGTNGFHLELNGNANDSSGNGNNFTANGTGSWDYQTDSPTNNFNTGMQTDVSGPGNLIEGNRRSYVTSQGNYYSVGTSIAVKGGKWYYECRPIRGGNNSSGLPDQRLLPEGRYCNSNSDPTGRIAMNIGTSDGSDGVYMVAMDLDNGYIYRGRNGSWSNGASASGISSGSGTGAVKTLTASEIDQYLRVCVTHRHDTGTSNLLWNFGQDSTLENYTSAGGNSDENGYGDFKYSVPTNFLAMCTQNLPDPAVDPAAGKSPDDYFNTVLYAGNGNTGQSITGVGFQPDFLWVKNRNMSGGYPHLVRDVVRGVTKRLRTNATDAEETSNVISSFDSDGFTFASGQGNSFENDSAGNYVSWNWKAGGTGVSNTDGSITSTVSANTDAGFSVVGWNPSTTSTGTVGHGLGVAPKLIIAKSRSVSSNWFVMHTDLASNLILNLESTAAAFNPGYNHFNDTYPTSSVFSIGGYLGGSVQTGDKIAYCFAEKDGYCKIGSYTGGGDGTYIHTGFKPAFVMVKNHNTSSHHWVLYDNKRYGYNTIGPYLYANGTGTESNATRVDFMSNGFVGRVSNYDIAQSGVGFIYMAFAEQPFKYANAR